MFDGTRLRQSWYTALDDAQSYFRQLLTSSSSQEWKRVPVPNENGSNPKGKGRASAFPELTDVALHRKSGKSGESVYRAVLDVPAGEAPMSLECWKAVLATPELRKEWDPAVEGAHLVEMFDQATRISKTNFSVGWPANPRDAVTISRTFNDVSTLIDISTSLPRSPDEPAYLRPSPPYVRSDVTLFSWCIQHVQPSNEHSGKSARLRITCFWQHNFRSMWNFGSASSFAQQLCAMVVGLFKSVKKRGMRIPLLTGYGNGVSIERIRFALDREALTVDYAIVPEDEEHAVHTTEQGLEELHAIREHRRLTRSIECVLPAAEGWDVQIATKASSEQVAQLPWTVHATRNAPAGGSQASPNEYEKVVFSVKHAALPNDHSVLKVKIVIELSGPSSGIRLNGIPRPIEEVEERDPSSYFISEQMLQDVSSTADLSFNTVSSYSSTVAETASRSSTLPDKPQLMRTTTERTAAAEKSILSRVKRNYIYFSSLLQEPEAKWKRTSEARGVSIAQLDSIDPTLVVYRAESTFVGLGLWDLYSAVVTPGARAYWDKLYEDGTLLEDVNELSELWHFKTKPTWPVNGRDAVVLKTVYKSPTTIHVFSFSADDPNLFPHIPPVDPNVIRTQIDLQGWAIEALSPTTTQLTLLEQSDPKGWSNKGSIPQQMITAVAGVGEFAIKCGDPPVLTRLDGAKANEIRYDHDRGSFRIEYEASASRRSTDTKTTEDTPASPALPVIECELRCDLDNWASSLDIVVDPPPQSISCLRRHRLSSGGGGLWLTITHDVVTNAQERLQAIVRRGPVGVPKERGLVMVNGSKVDVDVEEMPDREVKHLTKQKRIKPSRVPLDQPPVLGAIRGRKAEWNAEAESDSADNGSEAPASPTATEGIVSSQPQFATTLTRFFNYAVEQATTTTQQAVAAISPAMAAGVDSIPSATKAPMQYALEALSYIQSVHTQPVSDGWTLVSEKDFPVHRKLVPEISPVVPVHRGEKVIEGVSAEEVASVLNSYDCRKHWDNRFDSVHVLEVFGADAHTSFVVMKGGFPFRDRGFYLASLTARESAAPAPSRRNTGESEHSTENRTAIFCVSASFAPGSVSTFASSKYNSYALPVGRVFVDGWILETLDPYGKESYAIPSTRCTRVVAVDYAGSIPAALNSMINGMLPKSILAVETYVKNMAPPPSMRLPAAGVVVAHAAEDQPLPKSWTVRRRDASHALISMAYVPTDRVFRSCVLLDSAELLAPPTSNTNDRTPKASRMMPNAQYATDGSRPSSPQQSTLLNVDRSCSRDAVKSLTATAFTSRGEVRHPTDVLVSELIVDSKLYPDGYDVRVKSRIDKTKARIALPTSSADEAPSDNSLPIAHSIYTLPPSPLHSSGLNADRPPRQLVRLTLPTAQYQVSTLQDPLTGEMRSAPPKPQWLSDLEEGRLIVSVEIVPAPTGRANKGATVTVDGSAAAVLTEKESLTGLGRDELLDSRVSKMDLLSGSPAEAEQALPEELQVPVAIAEHLLDEAAVPTPSAMIVEAGDAERARGTPEPSQEASESHAQVVVAPAEAPAPDSAGSGLLRFFNAYPNPLLRLATRKLSVGGIPAAASEGTAPRGREDAPAAGGVVEEKEGYARVGVLTRGTVASTIYPLSTVVIVAVIAFLIGSLLRSLLSPSDFVYLVTDRREIDEVRAGGGWREIKRLLEVKYVLGGWDFQVAVVRRH